MSALETPLMQQYREIKARHPGAILFFRMGDFYEMFLEDAEVASRVLGLTIRDTQCGLKLFKASDALLGELEAPFRTRWFFEIEMILRRRSNGDLFRIREEPLEEWNEIGGSHISGKEIFRVFFEMLKLVSGRWI
jgi:hypothetical protein